MPTTRCQWAVGFFSFSLLLAAAFGAGGAESAKAPATTVEVLALELEAKLASKPDLYIVIDLGDRTFTVKSRGVELGTIALTGAGFLSYQQGVEPITVPAVLLIAGRAPAGERRVILPRELRPYSEDEEDAPPPLPNPKPGERLHRAPSEYRVRLDNGWWLEVAQTSPVPPPGFEGFKQRVRAGWDNLLGGRSEEPNLLSLVLSVEDAQRIHHLFQPERAILVTQ